MVSQWSINNRVFVRQYFPIRRLVIVVLKHPQTAEAYIKEQKGIDIETDEHRLDGEHYTTEIHEIIATDNQIM